MPAFIPAPKKKKLQFKGLPPGTKVLPIDASYFYAGMYIDSEIYMKINDTYVLFCKNVLMDDALLAKMNSRLMRTNYTLYVVEDYYDEIRKQSKDFAEIERRGEINDVSDYDSVNERIRLRRREFDSFVHIENDIRQILLAMESKIEISQEELDAIVGNISNKVQNTDISVILQCINNIRESDDYLYSHSRNVATLNGLIGKWMNLDDDQINKLIRIGLLHDLGKLRIPPEILNKPASLTDEEFEVIKKHPVYTTEILMEAGFTDKQLIASVRAHHERTNGMGYPDGLSGTRIPLYARITAVSDVYDAMVAKRPYKRSHSPFEILSEFSKSRFSDLDISVVKVFLENIPPQFIGKQALLSDGRAAKIVFLNPNDFEYPIVSVDGKLVKTNKFLKCVAVDSFSLDDI